MSQQLEKRLTPLRELIDTLERHKKLCKGANDFNKSWGIEIAIQEAKLLLPKEQQLLSEAFDAGVTATLKDIQKGFLDPLNQSKADHLRDREVFQAVGETIINFPHPSAEQFLSQFKQD